MAAAIASCAATTSAAVDKAPMRGTANVMPKRSTKPQTPPQYAHTGADCKDADPRVPANANRASVPAPSPETATAKNGPFVRANVWFNAP